MSETAPASKNKPRHYIFFREIIHFLSWGLVELKPLHNCNDIPWNPLDAHCIHLVDLLPFEVPKNSARHFWCDFPELFQYFKQFPSELNNLVEFISEMPEIGAIEHLPRKLKGVRETRSITRLVVVETPYFFQAQAIYRISINNFWDPVRMINIKTVQLTENMTSNIIASQWWLK